MALCRILRAGLLAVVTLFVCVTTRAQNVAAASPQIDFTVSMTQPHTHLFEVKMEVRPAIESAELDLVMPVWTPGSYLIREFARHVQDFAAEANGRALEWTKINKNTWRIKTSGAHEFRITYRVYANELSVRTSELNADHAFWNNATLLMYVDGFIKAPATLRVMPAPGWKIATGLPPVEGQANTFRAENFDILYDSPVEASDFKEIKFQVRGVPHRIVIDGGGNYQPDRIRDDVQKIVETQVALFGGIPYHDYTFILHLRADTGGGLEHLNSTALGFKRSEFVPEEKYQKFLFLVSHEFFHLWNVKRIRPDALGPFDYTKENYTRLLWVAEGITEYYGGLTVRRAGLITPRNYLDKLAKSIEDFQNTPGRLVVSAEEASFDTWIKFYRPDENTVNREISYYDKGELLGLLLDLEIRRRSGGAKSLDDVMRFLYTDFSQKDRNYTPADFQKACEAMAGGSLDQFFTRYVRGREDFAPVYNDFLSVAGLRLSQAGKDIGKTDAQTATKAFLGAEIDEKAAGDVVIIKNVRTGTPAYEQGLNAKDQIIALDGARVTKETFDQRLAEKRPGETLRVTVFRADDLRTFEVRLGSQVDAPYRILPLAQVSELQKRIYNAWLGEGRSR